MTSGSISSTDITDFADAYGITLMNQAQATLTPQLRELHRAILSAFVDTGTAPTVAWISDKASLAGLDAVPALTRLAEADLVHTADGFVTVAYPFSGTPTPHQVHFDDGPSTWAMCRGDALGIPLMTGRNATITSTDPQTGHPIRIGYHDGAWTWEPDSTVMLAAGTAGCATAAEAACRYIHFFTTHDNAHAYLRANPGLGGQIYDPQNAIEVGRFIFGSLLGR